MGIQARHAAGALLVTGAAVLASCTSSGQPPESGAAPASTLTSRTSIASTAPTSATVQTPATRRSTSASRRPATRTTRPPRTSTAAPRTPATPRTSSATPTHRSSVPPATSPDHPHGPGSLLRGKVIVIDPGHQLGNSTHLSEINRLVNAGGFMKACNTTGTATNSGYPEATFTWHVAQDLEEQLQARGATVYLTRHTNSYSSWGPCIDARGRLPNEVHADAAVSIHGDGAAPGDHGFFVIRPSDRSGWTSDIYTSSQALALDVKTGLVRAGVPVSNSYGGDGYDVRGDLGTLNWSNVPIVMVELANMRNASDAQHITSPDYRRNYFARGLLTGIESFVLNR